MVYCWKCGSALRDDATFCPKCGASVRGTMGVQGPTGFDLLRDDRNVQNHWARRLIAVIIDTVIISVALAVIALALGALYLIGLGLPNLTLTFPAWWSLWWAAWLGGALFPFLFIYSLLAEALYGRTIGKEVMGLRVEKIDGRRLDFRSSLIRNISKIYWVLLLLDVVVGLVTSGDMSQKWSDRFVGTKVEAKTDITVIP